jgi:hypothetical protein
MEAIDLFLGHPIALFIVLVIGAAFGIGLERLAAHFDKQKRKAYWRGRNDAKGKAKIVPIDRTPNKQEPADFAAEQLKVVSKAEFAQRPLLNRSEANVFTALDKAVIARNPGWQVMAQVSLGEFLASPDKDAYFAVNSKRVDFALMDDKCCVRHALEYQGNGHHLSDSTAARDAIKKEALRKAGIGYHEIVAGHTTPGELRALVEKLVPGA